MPPSVPLPLFTVQNPGPFPRVLCVRQSHLYVQLASSQVPSTIVLTYMNWAVFLTGKIVPLMELGDVAMLPRIKKQERRGPSIPGVFVYLYVQLISQQDQSTMRVGRLPEWCTGGRDAYYRL